MVSAIFIMLPTVNKKATQQTIGKSALIVVIGGLALYFDFGLRLRHGEQAMIKGTVRAIYCTCAELITQ